MAARFRSRRRRLLLLAGVAAVSGGVVAGLNAAGVLDDAELKSIDLRFQLRGSRTRRHDVVVVGVDPKTESELRVRPPYPRSYHARIIDFLHRANAKVIAYDVQFIGATTPRQDDALLAAIDRARPVLLATHDVNGPPLRVPAGITNPARIGAKLGSVAVPSSSDGILRQMFYENVGIINFEVAAAQMALGRPVSPSHFPSNLAWIDYAGPPGTYPIYSFSDVLRGRVAARAFAGKVVVVGYTDPDLNDIFQTPAASNQMSGPEVHANAIATILDGFPLTSAPVWANVILLVLAAVVVPLVSAFRRVGWIVVAAAVAMLALLVMLQLAFDSGLILNAPDPVLALALSTVGSIATGYLLETRERRRMRTIFSRFVPRDVVDDVIQRTDDDLRLGGIRRDGTVVFTDLRGFTSFAEQLQPEQVVAVVNHYLSEMTDAILAQGGTLVSYMGDGIMALFGAPLEQPDHADRALRAVREMLAVRLPRFNQWLREAGFEKAFRMGIGVNSGMVMSGNVGSAERLEYTALGDTTNTASRLESMTKEKGHQALVSGSTRERLHSEAEGLVRLGDAPVRGRAETIELWTLAEDEGDGDAGGGLDRPALELDEHVHE